MSSVQIVESPVAYPNHQPFSPSRLTLFCDLDGPLIDVSQRYYRTYKTALSQVQAQYQAQGEVLLLTPLSNHQFWQMKQSRTPDIEIARQSGLRNQQIEVFLQHVRNIVNLPQNLSQDRVQPGVREALARLHRWGVQLAVVTLRNQTQAIRILQQYKLAHWFTCIRGTQEHFAAYNNYAEQKQVLLAEVMAQPRFSRQNQQWMIGDTEADILAAQAMGISSIALTCGMRSHSYLQALQPNSIHQNLAAATSFLLGVEAA